MEKKYYEAYDDRYCQIHQSGLQWAGDQPTSIVLETMESFGITKNHRILELGCGEGRDAFHLLGRGYRPLATDISPEAIRFCREKVPQAAACFAVLDCVRGKLDESFDFIYAVSVIHMLVCDCDRDGFYGFIREHLTEQGIALICTMGDGKVRYQSDIRTAFQKLERTHGQSGRKIQVAGTSCRVVCFETFWEELNRNGLAILQEGITSAKPDFPNLMFAVVQKRKGTF